MTRLALSTAFSSRITISSTMKSARKPTSIELHECIGIGTLFRTFNPAYLSKCQNYNIDGFKQSRSEFRVKAHCTVYNDFADLILGHFLL